MFDRNEIFDSIEVEKYIENLREDLEHEDNTEDLEAALAFKSEVISRVDNEWEYGVEFIQDHLFTEHATEQASDILGQVAQVWPFTCIDWEEAAEEMKQDYSFVDYADGGRFWFRI